MADDDRTIRDAADRTRINMQEDYEVRYWTQKWSVTREQVAPAIRAAGVMVADVVKKLGKQGVRGVSSVLPPACVSSSRIRRPCVDPAWRLRASNIARSRSAML